MDEFINEFVVETQEGLTALDTALVAFSDQPDDAELLGKIFRTLHTIKGTCGFLGLARLEELSHTAETLLDRFRKNKQTATPDDVHLILMALDQIRDLVDVIAETGTEPEGDDTALLDSLQQAIRDDTGNDDGKSKGKGRDKNPDKESEPQQKPVIDLNDLDNLDIENLTEADLDRLFDDPEPDVAAPIVSPAASQEIKLPVATPEKTNNAAPVSAGSGSDTANQFLRIHVDRLEEMLAMVSELVLTRNQLSQKLRDVNDTELDEPLQRLDNIVSDLQDSVMKARMQPIGNAWTKFPRIIHDISRETGKNIRLVMKGEDTEVDRQVLELIKDPLLHMVRNAADHGIEMPSDRVAAGKEEAGIVTLSSWHERGYIVVEIRDDGRGLSAEKLKEKILERGLATAEHLSALSDKQIHSYIFAAGFSTAQAVTAISGRGVGMDVVRTNIEKIGGTIDLEAREGYGSCFTIRIPLTLAIIPTLLLESGKNRYAIPELAVQELVQISPDMAHEIEMIANLPVFRLRNRLLPLVPLDALLQGDTARYEPQERCFIAVVNTGTASFGLIVDTVLEPEEVVVKPVPAALRHMSFFAGNTVLGDGCVVMILDPAGIAAHLNMAGRDVSVSETDIEQDDDEHKGDQTELLIFKTDDATPKAVPAFLVSRIGKFPVDAFEQSGTQKVVQYEGRLIEIHSLEPEWRIYTPDKDNMATVIIFADDEQSKVFGIIVRDIVDIVRTPVDINDTGRRAGYLGSAIIQERTMDILDINHFTGEGGWLSDYDVAAAHGAIRRRVLLVDDSVFFRHMLKPLLSLAGYNVTVVPGPKTALALCERGEDFDMIVSDIEMEEMDGLTFAETVKSGSRWKDIPMVALSSHASEEDIEMGYSKGFSAYVSKSDREALLSTLREVFEKHHGKMIDAPDVSEGGPGHG